MDMCSIVRIAITIIVKGIADRSKYYLPAKTSTSLVLLAAYSHNVNAQHHQEVNDIVVIEAENFASQHKDEKRRWLVFSEDSQTHNYADSDTLHYKDASGGEYIEILPDTRTNHNETLVRGENFTNTAGEMAILSYPIYFETAGTYYVWARAFSTGSEDNGIHMGINGEWPESGQRLQLCSGKHKWTWSSAQRIKTNHCGTPNTITLDIPAPGVHTLMISMREDGFELDKLLLTRDKDYTPQGQALPETRAKTPALPVKDTLLDIRRYTRIFHAVSDFSAQSDNTIPIFTYNEKQALAINAAKPEYRNQYAYATVQIDRKDVGTRTLRLVTLAEQGGRSKYKVLLNNKEVGQFTNPDVSQDFQEMSFEINNITLNKGDIITVASMAVSEQKNPENPNISYSNGLWRALVLSRE